MTVSEPIESGEALFAFDGNLRLVHWNVAAEELTGFSAAEVLGRPCYEVLAGIAPDGSRVCVERCPYARKMMDGASPPGPVVGIRSAKGPRRLVSFSLLSVRGQGEPRYLHLVNPLERDEVASNRQGTRAEPELTPRQREVLALAASGSSLRRIAANLGIAETTVRNHLSLLQFKLDCASRAELLETARRLGLADPLKARQSADVSLRGGITI